MMLFCFFFEDFLCLFDSRYLNSEKFKLNSNVGMVHFTESVAYSVILRSSLLYFK